MAIVPRLSAGDETDNQSSIEKMDEYAAEGLRTLMFAKKEIANVVDANSLKEGDESMLEEDLTLLGVTGLEDLLQDNAADCIRDFRAAKIKVWMLTGDKNETALNISISCGIIDEESQNIYTIQGVTLKAIEDELHSII